MIYTNVAPSALLLQSGRFGTIRDYWTLAAFKDIKQTVPLDRQHCFAAKELPHNYCEIAASLAALPHRVCTLDRRSGEMPD